MANIRFGIACWVLIFMNFVNSKNIDETKQGGQVIVDLDTFSGDSSEDEFIFVHLPSNDPVVSTTPNNLESALNILTKPSPIQEIEKNAG